MVLLSTAQLVDLYKGGAPMRRRNISALNLKMPGAESERRVGAGEGPPAEAG